jgi:hypothetical protein
MGLHTSHYHVTSLQTLCFLFATCAAYSANLKILDLIAPKLDFIFNFFCNLWGVYLLGAVLQCMLAY